MISVQKCEISEEEVNSRIKEIDPSQNSASFTALALEPSLRGN